MLLSAAPGRAATAAVAIASLAPSAVAVGDDFTSTLTVTNSGPDVATGVEVTDPLSASLVLASASTDHGVCNPGATVSCDIGPLASGESAEITVIATAVRPGAITTSATVTSPDDSTAGDNTAARTVSATGPTCTIVGTPGPDALLPTNGLDVICGLGGADTIQAGYRDRVLAGDGDDIVTATAVRTVLEGGVGDDRLTGGAGADLLRGGIGHDAISGGDGDDHLEGGPGADTLAGGADVDACVEAGSSCHRTSPTDADDTGGPLDIRLVSTTFGKTATFVVNVSHGWSRTSIWERGFFQVKFDTTGSSAADYVAVARSWRGALTAILFRVSPTPEKKIANLVVRQLSSRRISIAVPIKYMNIDASRTMYRWAAQTLWISSVCARSVCLDGVPAPIGMLPQPIP